MYSFTTSHQDDAASAHIPTPFSDNFGRKINYLRLAITNRCNLRCRYCIPENSDQPYKEDALRLDELERLAGLFKNLGVTKIRLTGGEPFVRKDLISFVSTLNNDIGFNEICITTNGVAAKPHLKSLQDAGLTAINLSLDSLRQERFKEITGRDRLSAVLATFYRALELNIPLKVNSVVCSQTQDEEITELASLAEKYPISLRFIEEMPFCGRLCDLSTQEFGLEKRLHALYPDLREIQNRQASTARLFSKSGFAGTIGIIEGHSRKFCASCNKVRITPEGMLKGCLYDSGLLDLRHLLQAGTPDWAILSAIGHAVGRRHEDGHATEKAMTGKIKPSMATIGG